MDKFSSRMDKYVLRYSSPNKSHSRVIDPVKVEMESVDPPKSLQCAQAILNGDCKQIKLFAKDPGTQKEVIRMCRDEEIIKQLIKIKFDSKALIKNPDFLELLLKHGKNQNDENTTACKVEHSNECTTAKSVKHSNECTTAKSVKHSKTTISRLIYFILDNCHNSQSITYYDFSSYLYGLMRKYVSKKFIYSKLCKHYCVIYHTNASKQMESQSVSDFSSSVPKRASFCSNKISDGKTCSQRDLQRPKAASSMIEIATGLIYKLFTDKKGSQFMISQVSCHEDIVVAIKDVCALSCDFVNYIPEELLDWY
jgi:hypothetical protein